MCSGASAGSFFSCQKGGGIAEDWCHEGEIELDKLREMGAKTKSSVFEAAEAMNYMAIASWKTGDMLDGVEGIMNLAG